MAATSPSHFAVTLSTSIEKPFKIFIETINFASEVRDLSSLKLGFQIGLFHGGKPLEPLKTIFLKGPPENGTLLVNHLVEFEILVANLPRMAKLCFGLYEKRTNYSGTKGRTTILCTHYVIK